MAVIKYNTNILNSSYVSLMDKGIAELSEAISILDSVHMPSSFAYSYTLKMKIDDLRDRNKALTQLSNWVKECNSIVSTYEDTIRSEILSLEMLSVQENESKINIL